jgi:hypothetical protein
MELADSRHLCVKERKEREIFQLQIQVSFSQHSTVLGDVTESARPWP